MWGRGLRKEEEKGRKARQGAGLGAIGKGSE